MFIKSDPEPLELLEGHVQRGKKYLEFGEYQKALKDAQEALKIKPDSPKAIEIKGHALLGKGNFENAIKVLKDAQN